MNKKTKKRVKHNAELADEVLKLISVWYSQYWKELDLCYDKQGFSDCSKDNMKIIFDLVCKMEGIK